MNRRQNIKSQMALTFKEHKNRSFDENFAVNVKLIKEFSRQIFAALFFIKLHSPFLDWLTLFIYVRLLVPIYLMPKDYVDGSNDLD